MKPDLYAHALLSLVKRGMKPSDAVAAVKRLLNSQGRAALMPHIARAFERIAERDAQKERSVLIVAQHSDVAKAQKESGVKDAEIVVDKDIIGGWRLESKERLVDASWKTGLLSMYNRATDMSDV